MSDDTTPGAGANEPAKNDPTTPAALAAAPASCWLIEGQKADGDPSGVYLSGEDLVRCWSRDAHAAVRFARREDAAAVIELFGVKPSTPTEHLFE